MKKLIIGLGIAAMVMGMAVGASAAPDTDWLVVFRASNDAGRANGNLSCGTKAGASDGWVTPGQDASQSSISGAEGKITTNVDSSLVAKDLRAPLAANQTKTWNITTWLVDDNGLFTAGNISLSAWISTNTIASTIDTTPYVITLTGGGIAPIVFDSNSNKGTKLNGSQTNPLFTRTIAFDGTNKVNLTLTASTIADAPVITPEPGSMVAMLSGFAGLVGFGIRRRK